MQIVQPVMQSINVLQVRLLLILNNVVLGKTEKRCMLGYAILKAT